MLATQNPIEQEGTYPLPEAQLDRFMFNVVIDYPTADEERRILVETTGTADPKSVGASRRGDEIETAAHPRPRRAGGGERRRLRARLVRATRPADEDGAGVRAQVGALGRRSARGPGAAARRQGARAARRTHGRRRRRRHGVALPVLRHRVLVNFQAEADGIDADEIVRQLLTAVR